MKLRELLKEKGIPKKVVADALGVHQNNLPRYDELRKRSIDEVIIISKATGISISDLIGEELELNTSIISKHNYNGEYFPENLNDPPTTLQLIEILKGIVESNKIQAIANDKYADANKIQAIANQKHAEADLEREKNNGTYARIIENLSTNQVTEFTYPKKDGTNG